MGYESTCYHWFLENKLRGQMCDLSWTHIMVVSVTGSSSLLWLQPCPGETLVVTVLVVIVLAVSVGGQCWWSLYCVGGHCSVLVVTVVCWWSLLCWWSLYCVGGHCSVLVVTVVC